MGSSSSFEHCDMATPGQDDQVDEDSFYPAPDAEWSSPVWVLNGKEEHMGFLELHDGNPRKKPHFFRPGLSMVHVRWQSDGTRSWVASHLVKGKVFDTSKPSPRRKAAKKAAQVLVQKEAPKKTVDKSKSVTKSAPSTSLPDAETTIVSQDSDRDSVMNLIPESIKNRFGLLGFARWQRKDKTKYSLPVICVSPFHLPEGVIRLKWFRDFELMQREEKALRMIVYWYSNATFSLVDESDFIRFDNPEMKELMRTVKDKEEEGSRLTPNEKCFLKGLKKMEEDRAKFTCKGNFIHMDEVQVAPSSQVQRSKKRQGAPTEKVVKKQRRKSTTKKKQQPTPKPMGDLEEVAKLSRTMQQAGLSKVFISDFFENYSGSKVKFHAGLAAFISQLKAAGLAASDIEECVRKKSPQVASVMDDVKMNSLAMKSISTKLEGSNKSTSSVGAKG